MNSFTVSRAKDDTERVTSGLRDAA